MYWFNYGVCVFFPSADNFSWVSSKVTRITEKHRQYLTGNSAIIDLPAMCFTGIVYFTVQGYTHKKFLVYNFRYSRTAHDSLGDS